MFVLLICLINFKIRVMIILFFFLIITVTKIKTFYIFNFYREPYRTQIRSVYRFINGKK